MDSLLAGRTVTLKSPDQQIELELRCQKIDPENLRTLG